MLEQMEKHRKELGENKRMTDRDIKNYIQGVIKFFIIISFSSSHTIFVQFQCAKDH